MRRCRPLAFGVVVLVVLVLFALGTSAPVLGQGRPAGPQASLGSPPAPAPVTQFPPEGVSLEDAVRMTLANDPAIQTSQSDVRRQEGVVQQRAGQFDMTLLLKAAFNTRTTELSEARKADERDQRNQLRDFVSDSAGNVALTQQIVARLDEIQRLPPGAEQVRQLTQISPTLGSQVQVLDTLITNAPGAERDTLLRIRQDLVVAMLADQRAMLTEFQTAYRDAQTQLTNIGEAPTDEVFRSGTFAVKLSKYFRNGLGVEPFVDAAVDSTVFAGKKISTDFGGKGIQDVWTFRAGVNVMFPLFRGRGSEAFSGSERASRAELEASRLALEHQSSRSALAVVRAYWELRAAQDALDVIAKSAGIEQQIVEVTNALILAEELPRNELARAQAGEARVLARLDDARRRVLDGRVGLVRVMGLSATESEATLPRARDAFPELATEPALPDPEIEALAAAATDRRKDLSASQRYEEAGQILEKAASLYLKPRLDLSAGTWATALGERTVSRVIDRWVLPSVGVGLEYEQPFRNNTLHGQFVQREAEHRQRQIATADLARQVRLGIVRSARALKETWDRVQLAASAAAFYQTTVEAELERFRAGETTLINTLITEQQLTEAQLTLVAARRDLANLVAELRYETGTLVSGGTVAGATLATIPTAGGR